MRMVGRGGKPAQIRVEWMLVLSLLCEVPLGRSGNLGGSRCPAGGVDITGVLPEGVRGNRLSAEAGFPVPGPSGQSDLRAQRGPVNVWPGTKAWSSSRTYEGRSL